MAHIGIVGAGISGLHLALFLQAHGVDTTLYAERGSDGIRRSRLPNLVARFGHTRERERKLDADDWGLDDFATRCAHVRVLGEPPLGFCGRLNHPAVFLDFRIYLAELLDGYESRGGRVVLGPVRPTDVAGLGERHDLVVVSAGREVMADLFPPDRARSPYSTPQRVLCAGLYRGIAFPEPLGLSFNISPGAGEVFQSPFFSFEGRLSGLLFEAVPGQALEHLAHVRYEDDPDRFHRLVLDALRDHAPAIYERVDRREFALTGPVDLLQGAITPVVRRAWAPLDGGVFAMAVGDAWVLNDPLTGQGANTGSHCAWVLGQTILDDDVYDERFCRTVEARMWEYVQDVTEWTNAFLQPPAPHLIDVLVAAAHDQAVADAFIDGFSAPRRMWRNIATPERTRAFLERSRSAPNPEERTPAGVAAR